ncbi:MAG TPA: DUF5919 domain-containing protein [Nocardioidaceae bacterium]|nr:DUF5919 domain-containing protein [Nocardioidaceae bacterium]
MENERLRAAMVRAHVSVEDVQRGVDVDLKTVQRWLKGRVPHQRFRWAVAGLLEEDEAYLWPTSAVETAAGAGSTAEVVAAYARRAEIDSRLWVRLIDDSRRHVSILGYAALFLPETYPGLAERLVAKAEDGCEVQIALADPSSPEVKARDAEEGLHGGLVARIQTALERFRPVIDSEAAELRLHHEPMYNSVFRFDDQMLVTPHLYHRGGFESPALHLRRLGEGGIFDTFALHFDEVWTTGVLVA